MILAKLFVLGQERELLWTDMGYERDIRMNGKPSTEVMGGLITVCYESQGDDDVILRWLTKPLEDDTWEEIDKMAEGKVCFYNNGFDYPPTKTYKFNDALLIYYKEVFYTEGIQPMKTIITISPAIQNYGADFVKLWNESWILPSERMPYQPMEQEQEVDLKFIAKFERLSRYKGDFGFDWMRDNYTNICQDYENLKQEYTPTTIHGEEYFVPWLSMFQNQTGVKLKLSIKEKEGAVKDSDIIKLPSKNGIKFVPDELKVSEANGKEITILCESVLSNDTVINLLDKDDNTVGKLNILKNDENLTLKVKLVKVKGNEEDNRYNEQTFSSMSDSWESELFDSLTNKCLNQALIKVEKEATEEMVIDVDKYIEAGALDVFIDGEGKRGIPRMNKGFDKKLYEDFVAKNGEYKGVIFFLSAMHQKGTEAGHGYPYPRDINYIMIVPSSVGGILDTYGHELGHTLGLHHPWADSDIYEVRLSKIEERIEYLKKYLDDTKQYSDSTKIKDSDKTIGDVRKRINNELLELEIEKNDRIELTPTHSFEKATTENIMDYNGYKTPEGLVIHNPHSKGISFWSWQWEMIINEVKKYHGK